MFVLESTFVSLEVLARCRDTMSFIPIRERIKLKYDPPPEPAKAIVTLEGVTTDYTLEPTTFKTGSKGFKVFQKLQTTPERTFLFTIRCTLIGSNPNKKPKPITSANYLEEGEKRKSHFSDLVGRPERRR